MRLAYDVYFGPIRAVVVDVRLTLDATAYAMEAAFRTEGAIRLVLPWEMRAAAHGGIAGDRVAPKGFETESRWRGRRRWRRLAYEPDGTINISAEPAIAEDGAVPDALRRHTVDLASALVAALRGTGRDGACTRGIAVFDGKHRYDLNFRDLGPARIETSRTSAYSGAARACRFEMVEIIPGAESPAPDDTRKAVVWIAGLSDSTPPVPVRLVADGSLGAVRAKLVRAEIRDRGGLRQRVGAAYLRARGNEDRASETFP